MGNSQLVLAQLINGIVSGGIYALLAVGLTIIFGMMNFVNFAHGIFYVLGAYAAFISVHWLGNFWVGLILGPIVIGALAMALERTFLKKLYRIDVKYTILATFGLSLILREIIILVFEARGQPVFPPASLEGIVNLGVTLFPVYRIFLFGVAGVTLVLLWYLIERTKLGAVIRAGIEYPDMVSCLGINVHRVFTLTFGLGVALAALSGVLMAPIRGVEPFMGDMMQGVSFAVVIIGGLGSFAGAIIAGFIVGIVESLVVLVSPSMSLAAIFLTMVAILLMRPHGLFGSER